MRARLPDPVSVPWEPEELVRLEWISVPELEELLVEIWLRRAVKRLAEECQAGTH